MSPETLKVKAFEIFRQLSIRGSLRRPIVLVVEDLQWIDAISQEFLSLLSENLPELRLLLLATYRPGHAPPWIDKSYAGQIPLWPLSQADSLRVVRPVLRHMGLSSGLADVIADKAQGNLFFLEQLAFHAGESAAVQAGSSVPATIRDVVMARIDRLPEETKRVLQLAAVIGREFSFRLSVPISWSRAIFISSVLLCETVTPALTSTAPISTCGPISSRMRCYSG